MENEVIFKDDLTKIFGERQWKSYEEEQLIKLDDEKAKSDKAAAEKKTKKLAKEETITKKESEEKLD